MGSIQQGINQLLGMAMVAKGLYQHSPAGKKRAAAKALDSSISNSRKAQEAIDAAQGSLKGRSKAVIAQRSVLKQERTAQGKIEVEGLREKFRKDPSAANLKNYMSRQAELDPDLAMQGTLQKMMKESKQREKRRNFQQEIKNERISFNGQKYGKFGDLPPSVQAQIEQAYREQGAPSKRSINNGK